jgi:hypothetical protein
VGIAFSQFGGNVVRVRKRRWAYDERGKGAHSRDAADETTMSGAATTSPATSFMWGSPSDVEAERRGLIGELRRGVWGPLKVAKSYRRLLGLGMSQTAIAKAVFCSRASVSYALRLLELPEEIGELIDRGELKVRHGRALRRYVGQPGMLRALAARVVAERWSCARLESELQDNRGGSV